MTYRVFIQTLLALGLDRGEGVQGRRDTRPTRVYLKKRRIRLRIGQRCWKVKTLIAAYMRALALHSDYDTTGKFPEELQLSNLATQHGIY